MALNVFVTGQKSFGAAATAAILEAGHNVVGTCSPAFAEPHGHLQVHEEFDGVRWDRLRTVAHLEGLPWKDARVLKEDDIPDGTDVILAAHSHAFVGRRTRSHARVSIGYHPSLLPLHRGRDAIRWALHMNERVLGGSVYHLTDTVDAGPLAAQEFVIVPPDLTPSEAWRDYLFPLGIKMLIGVLEDIENGYVRYEPQNEKLATWEPSWERPPLHRPELPELPPIGGLQGLQFVNGRDRRD